MDIPTDDRHGVTSLDPVDRVIAEAEAEMTAAFDATLATLNEVETRAVRYPQLIRCIRPCI